VRPSQVVYQELRQPLLEDLYRHSVEMARLGPVLEHLDETLGTLCSSTPKELHAGAKPRCHDPYTRGWIMQHLSARLKHV
jgi:hypothetical protein